MGKKSTAKASPRSSSDTPPPDEPKRYSAAFVTAIAVVVVGVIGVFAYVQTARQADVAPQASTAAPAPAVVLDPPPAAKFGPHHQDNLPPLPFQAYAPPRSPEVVRAAYVFAAEHPEILSYVPCFCGCEKGGHRGNEDCFVSGRNEKGDVTEWEPHGLDCAVCLDVAHDAEQMFRSGASARDIRAAIEKKWAGTGSHDMHPPLPK